MKKIFLYFVFLLCTVSVFGQSKKTWEKTKSINSISAYEDFIKKYPNGKFTPFAKLRIDSLAYIAAVNINTISSYKKYLQDYPIGKYKSNAFALSDSLEYEQVKSENKLEICQAYLTNYRGGKYRKNVLSIMEPHLILWAKSLNTEDSYKEYLLMYPYGEFWETATQEINRKRIQFYIQFLNGSQNEKVAALNMLGKIKDPEPIKYIIPLLQDRIDKISKAASIALKNLNCPATQILPLLKDERWFVRRNALIALGDINDPESVQYIYPFLKSELCVDALESLGKLKNYESVKYIIPLLDDSNTDVRQAAISALGSIQNPTSIQFIIPILKDKNQNISQSAILALGRFPGTVQYILPLLSRNKSGSIEFAPRTAIESIKDSNAVKYILPLLQDKDWYIRKIAVTALGSIKAKSAVQYILPSLKDENIIVKESALEALGEIKDPATVQYIIAIIKYENDVVRESAVKALGKIPGTKQDIISLLKSKDYYSITGALETLGEMEATDVVSYIIPFLKDENANLRNTALDALGCLKDTRSVQYIVPKLNDGTYGVWEHAASALGKIHGTMNELLGLLKHKNPEVRKIAAAILRDQIVGGDSKLNLNLYIAEEDNEMIKKNWDIIKPMLVNDLNNYETINYAVSALLTIGNKDAIPDMISAMNKQHGTLIPLTFLHCGQPQLKIAAQEWARMNGYEITTSMTSGETLGSWGN